MAADEPSPRHHAADKPVQALLPFAGKLQHRRLAIEAHRQKMVAAGNNGAAAGDQAPLTDVAVEPGLLLWPTLDGAGARAEMITREPLAHLALDQLSVT